MALKMKVEYVNRLFIQYDYSLLFYFFFARFCRLTKNGIGFERINELKRANE